MKTKALRRSLLIALAVLSQGILAVHDAQHVDAQPSTCTVCQAHLPQISGETAELVCASPLVTAQQPAPLCVRMAQTHRPYTIFQSRAPPGNLT